MPDNVPDVLSQPEPADASCVHRWRIGSTAHEKEHGVCANCGATREFTNQRAGRFQYRASTSGASVGAPVSDAELPPAGATGAT